MFFVRAWLTFSTAICATAILCLFSLAKAEASTVSFTGGFDVIDNVLWVHGETVVSRPRSPKDQRTFFITIFDEDDLVEESFSFILTPQQPSLTTYMIRDEDNPIKQFDDIGGKFIITQNTPSGTTDLEWWFKLESVDPTREYTQSVTVAAVPLPATGWFLLAVVFAAFARHKYISMGPRHQF